MKKDKKKKHFSLIIILATLFLIGCKPDLDDRQKLFLEYAKLEDKYHNTGYYRNLDLYNLNDEPIVYQDSAFNINTFKASVIKNFKIYNEDDQIIPDLGGYDLQFPHQYVLVPQKDGSIQTKLSVFVPETYFKFSLSSKDIGKPIMKDSTEITLLDLTNDTATLLVENKAIRQSYDYTYDLAERKDTSEKEEYELPKAPGYGDYLFGGENLDAPNSAKTEIKDSLMRISYARIDMSLSDDAGKVLQREGRVNDFRHYLWYRNNDMPYQDLVSNYINIKSKYKELDTDPKHKFHPIYIVNLQASGKIKQVDFFLRSRKGRVETIDLGNVKPQAKPTKAITDETEFPPLANIEKETLKKLLKINYTTVPVKLNEPENIVLYASVPYGYNNNKTNMTFENVKIIDNKKDTVAIDDLFRADDYFNISHSNNYPNLDAVHFSPKYTAPIKVIGEIDFGITNYYDKEYNINQLPKGFSLAPDGITLTINKKEPTTEYISAIYAFAKGNKKKALSTVRIENYDYASENSILRYVQKPTYLIIRYIKNKDRRMEEKVPFELNIIKKEKENQ